MTKCELLYDSLRESCIKCEDNIKCDNDYCYMRMLFTDNKEEIDFLNARIANNLGG